MAATLAGTFAACEGNENNPEEKDKPEVVSPEINVASGQSLSLVISDEGGSETISFTTNKGWVATVAHPWLKLSQNQGTAGNATITVTASPNPDFEERSTTVTIKCETVTTAVKVTQKQKGALILSASSIPVSDEGETISITLKANSAVTANVSKGADWIIPLETKGLVETVLQFTVLANDETDAREGEITFTNEAGSETVKIVQAAKGAIVISPTEIPVGAEGEAISITVKSNTDYTVAVTKGDEWIIPLETKGLVETVRQFNILANEGYDPREGEITFTCASGSQTVKIIQKEKVVLVLTDTEIPVKAEGETISITVKANADISYLVTAGDEWILPVITKGLVETTVQFNILANQAAEPREGMITFSNEAGSQNVIIKQAAADEEPEEPEEPVNPYGDEELPMLTEETVWAGEVFDAIIAKNAPDATEWISEDGVNFIESKLGFFAGSTTGVNADTGVETVTYGKFKFKKDEKAYNNGTKMSRVQMGGTGVLGKRNILQFKVNGPGALTIIGRSSGDAARAINFAVGSTPVSAEGYTLPGKASDSQKVSVEIQAAEGDIISVYSMESGIKFYSLKWVPGGKAEGGDEPSNPDDPQNPDLPTTALEPVTQTTSWASTFATLIEVCPPETYPDGITVDFTYNNLGFVAGGGKFKFNADKVEGVKTARAQLGGIGEAGKKNCIQFKASGNGKVTIVARSASKTDARSLTVALGTNDLQTNEVPACGNENEVTPVTFEVPVTASSGDLVNIYSQVGGVNIYDLKWVPEGGNDEPEPEPAGDSDDLECPNPPTVGQVSIEDQIGYGASVTGGKGATANNILHFNNGKAFQTWLLARTKSEKAGDHSPVEIWLSGTFTPDQGRDFSEAHPWFDVKDVSNLSIYGTDGFVMDRIGIFCVRANNIIIRNINFRQPKANNGADAVSMQNCDGVWVDHCTFTSLNQTKDYEDGSCDITHASKNVTVSWCHFIKTQKSCLVGHSNSASADAAITVTFHHNWFDQSSSRHPRVRFGKAHVYNNLYDGCTTYGAGSAYGAKVLVEYNYFDAVQLPTDICTYPAKENGNSNLQGSVAGYLYATQNMYVNKPAKAKSPYPLTNVKYTAYNGSTITPLTYNDFKPTYSYTVNAAEDVPAVVKEGAGYGKLGYTSAPVAVNNGDITEFNGADDNPEDPDPEDPDDPDTPVVSGPHVYTLSMQNKAPVQTLDGQSGASYFDASTSVADFSKDYSGSFTIDGTVFSQGFKFDSKGYAKFTTSSEYTTKVRFYFARRKNDNTGAKIMLVSDGGAEQTWDTPWDTFGDSGEVTLEKGMGYTVKQKTSEQALIYMVITESE